jgi:hypothetical protein
MLAPIGVRKLNANYNNRGVAAPTAHSIKGLRGSISCCAIKNTGFPVIFPLITGPGTDVDRISYAKVRRFL